MEAGKEGEKDRRQKKNGSVYWKDTVHLCLDRIEMGKKNSRVYKAEKKKPPGQRKRFNAMRLVKIPSSVGRFRQAYCKLLKE